MFHGIEVFIGGIVGYLLDIQLLLLVILGLTEFRDNKRYSLVSIGFVKTGVSSFSQWLF